MASLTCQRQMGASARPATARRTPVLRVVAQAAPAAPAAPSHSVPASKLIDGKGIADTIRSEIATEVAAMKKQYGLTPGLAVVLVGARKDSETYVRSKKKACGEVRPGRGAGVSAGRRAAPRMRGLRGGWGANAREGWGAWDLGSWGA